MKTLNFVIPLYNEEERLEKTIIELKAGFKFSGIDLKNIIFVDDGSSDETSSIIEDNKNDIAKALNVNVDLISYKPNKGKGNAVRIGMLASKADYTLFFDADMSTPLSEFEKMIPYIEDHEDVIIGTRKNGKSTVVKAQPLHRQILGKGFTFLSNILLNTWVSDFTCGFKVFSKEAAQNIFSHSKVDRWGYDAELMFLANRLGYKIQEVPVMWMNDDRSKVNLLQDLPRSLRELFDVRWYAIAGKYDKAVKKNNSTASLTEVVGFLPR